MGLFSKKEKKPCPICGNPLSLFASISIKDGVICQDCEKMIRGQFDVSEYWKQKWGTDGLHREDYQLKTSDPLVSLTVEEVRELIAQKKEQKAAVCQEYGAQYDNLARVESYFSIAPKALEVGLKRAKELKDRIVTTSLVVSGSFARGDSVTLVTNGTETATKVLDVIVCSDSSPFETELQANMGKHKADADINAWIILDVTGGVQEGSIIYK